MTPMMGTRSSGCYRLNCAPLTPQKRYVEVITLQYLRMGPYLEMEKLQIELVKIRS